MAGHWTVTE
jgi:hypothetical protein